MSEATEERVRRDGDPRGEGTSFARLALIVAATVLIGVRLGLPTMLVIAALIFMIFMHELGHYVTAKAAGMKVTEFFIGFGPRLWSFHRGETEYGLKAIPAGAYVRIIGMSNLEEVPPEDEARTYRQQPYWRRLSVAVAGSAMHFLMAIALMFAILVGFGEADGSRWTIGTVSPDSAAEAAGLRPGDRVLALDGRSFDDYADFAAHLRSRPGEEVELLVDRGGERRVLTTTLGTSNPDLGSQRVGFLGVSPDVEAVRTGPLEGAVEAVSRTGETMWLSVKGLGAFFSPSGLSGYLDTLTADAPGDGRTPVSEGENRLLSPVGAVNVATQAAETGVAAGLSFLFLINVFVGVFNLVPLLPLDGGHVAIATYERIRSRRGRRYFADVTKLMPLTYAVVLVLVVVGMSALYLDIVRPLDLR